MLNKFAEMVIRIFLLAGLVIGLPFPATAQDLPGRITAIPYHLSQSNPAVQVTAADDKIVIVAPKGSDLFTPPDGKTVNTAPRLTFKPLGDFIFSAKIASAFGGDYDGGALVIYGDDGYWAKLLFERVNSGEAAVTSSFASPAGDNSYHVRVPTGTSAVWLKIARIDRALFFYTSQDGKTWQILRDFTVDPTHKLAVGFAAQAPLAESYTATFSDIRFEARKFTNYWQGE